MLWTAQPILREDDMGGLPAMPELGNPSSVDLYRIVTESHTLARESRYLSLASMLCFIEAASIPSTPEGRFVSFSSDEAFDMCILNLLS